MSILNFAMCFYSGNQLLERGSLNPNEKNALNRQLTSSILAHSDLPNIHERNHIALLLVQKYPCLKGSYGTGHVSVILFIVLCNGFLIIPQTSVKAIIRLMNFKCFGRQCCLWSEHSYSNIVHSLEAQ